MSLENNLKTDAVSVNNPTNQTGGLGVKRRVRTGLPALVLAGLTMLGSSVPIRAATQPLQYHGGPVLENFTIYPLYYGSWQTTDIINHQQYLMALAAYMSGQNAPFGQEPTTRQYGVTTVKIASYATSNAPAYSAHQLTPNERLDIIHTNQTPGSKLVCLPPIKPGLPPRCTTEPVPAKLPHYGRNILIAVFLGQGFSTSRGTGVGYHSSESPSSFFAFLPDYRDAKGNLDVGSLQLVTAHEVLEAATDPAGFKTTRNSTGGLDCEVHDGTEGWTYFDNLHYGCETPPAAWAEVVDQCGNTFSYTAGAKTWTLTGMTDNTLSGSCSTSGYTLRPFPLPLQCGVMYPNQALIANTPREHVSSCDGQFSLGLEEHGYMALEFNSFNGSYLWNSSNISSDFSAKSGVMAIMQGDGNFVVYRGFEPVSSNAVWSTNTWGHPGAYLAIQNDGNLVIYAPGGTSVLWKSDTCCH